MAALDSREVQHRQTRSTPVRLARGVAGLLAIAAIVGGAVAASMAIFSRQSGEPEPTLDANLVAVAALENRTGDVALDPLGRQAAAQITQAVQQHGVADIVSAEVPLAAGNAPERPQGSEVASALARARGAGVIIHGTYYLVGDSLEFQIRITDVAEGELMSAPRPLMTHRETSDDALRLVEERTLGALAAALDYRADDLDFPTQPPSLEAYRLFWQGIDARWRYEREEALGFIRQAGAMDSTWISPLLYESLTLSEMSRFAEEDSVLQVAAGRREHMSELEHLMFQALLALNADGDRAIGLQSARELAAIAPSVGLRWGYIIALFAHRPQEGLEFLARVDTTGPRFKRLGAEYWRLSSTMHHLLGRFEAQLEAARDGRSRFPDHMYLLGGQITALAALGRTAETEALLDTVLALPGTVLGGSSVVTPQLRALDAAAEFQAHGFHDAGQTVAQRGLEWLETRPAEWRQEHAGWYEKGKAAFLYELGRWEEARDLYDWLAKKPDYWYTGHPVEWESYILASLAGAAARLQDLERARAIRTELAARTNEALKADADRSGAAGKSAAARLFLCQARIAAVLGEREEAVRLLSEGFRFSRAKGLYVDVAHRQRDFDSLRDYPPYRQFLKPRG